MADPESSPIAKFVTVTLPDSIMQVIQRYIGRRAVNYVRKLGEHSLLMIYLVVVLGSWSIMFAYGYPFITRSNHVDDIHKKMGYLVFACCMWSWRKAHLSSPGYITDRNLIQYDNYPYDDFLFINKKCPTLGIRKLPRSKYDRFTNRHVARFDHYCGWVKNTIGEQNYRYFLLFLIIHVLMCFYGTIVTWNLFQGEIVDRDLFNAIFFNGATGEEAKADLWIVTHYLFMKHFPLAAVFILMTVMCIVLGLFTCFHFWIAANGMTTNEYYKWKQVSKWHKKEKAKFERAKREGRAIHPGKSDVKIGDGDVGCVGPTGQSENVTNTDPSPNTIADPGPYPTNIYNLGIVENYKEILFPRCLRKDALQRLREERMKSGRVVVTVANDGKTKAI